MSLASIVKVIKEVKEKNDIREDFEFEGVKFWVGLVTRDEEIKANVYASGYTGMSNILMLDVATLAYAVKNINGVELYQFMDDEEGKPVETAIFMREQLLTLPSPIIDKLIGSYHIAKNKLRKKLGLTVLEFDSLMDAARNNQKEILEVNIPDVEEMEMLADNYVDQEAYQEGY